jgi:hypothetical protein
MSEISKLIAEIKSAGILRAGNKLEQLYGLAEQVETDYAALQQKLDAMAAENAALKSFITKNCFVEDDSSDYGFADASISMPSAPATDAYLNSVRAEGVEMLAAKITKSVSDEGKPDSHHAYAYIAMNFADQLLSGTHDTADKAG